MHPVGEERKKALESVLTERFVKVHVKHITDGQVSAGFIKFIILAYLISQNDILFKWQLFITTKSENFN